MDWEIKKDMSVAMGSSTSHGYRKIDQGHVKQKWQCSKRDLTYSIRLDNKRIIIGFTVTSTNTIFSF